MISTIQKTLSDAFSSLTSAKKPKLLKRPPTHISSQPNDPATSPQTVPMPQKRQSTPSIRNTKRRKGRKAAEFLSKHFKEGEEEDDPIETSSSPEPHVRRIKPSSHSSVGKRQESSKSDGQKKADSKPQITHKHLIKDLDDERSLIPCNVPPGPDAFYIEIPGSTMLNRNSSSITSAGSRLRPINTLDTPKQSQGSSNSGRNLVPPHIYSSTGGYEKHTYNSKTDLSIRNNNGEPLLKRRRIEPDPTAHAKHEAAEVISPSLSPFQGQTMTIANSGTSMPQNIRLSPTKAKSQPSPVSVNEYTDVEQIMRHAPISRKTSHTAIGSSRETSVNGYIEQPSYSDPESATRTSEKVRDRENGNHHSGTSPKAQPIDIIPATSEPPKNTPPAINVLFPTTYSPSDVGNHNVSKSERPHAFVAAAPTSYRPNDSSKSASTGPSEPNQVPRKRSQTSTTEIASARRKQVAESLKRQDAPSNMFPLRGLLYGFLPPESNYSAVIQGATLEISDSEPLLGDGPLWCLPLNKVLKVLRGADDCSMLLLQFPNMERQPSNRILLDFHSREDQDDFVSLARDAYVDLSVEKTVQTDFMQRAFKHQQEIYAKEQRKRPEHNISRQPIRKGRIVSGTVSPHFQNQQQSSSHTTSTRRKLINELQSASSCFKITGADSKIPTVISGRDRANPFALETPAEIFSAVKERVSAQSGPTNATRLRFPSRKIPITRSSLASEGSTHQKEENMPRKKYSEEHGLGVPWNSPLIYPKTGRRRETVEFEDLYRLDEDEFLNDNLIGFFLRYLEQYLEQSRPDLAKKVYFYNSYFFERLMQTSKGKKGIDYESVQKWTRNIDIFSRDFVVVPVNESFHWYVVIICNLSKLNTVEDDEDVVETSKATSQGPVVASIEESDQAQRHGAVNSTQDPPTQQTTDSLSQLSLSEHDKQVDELATSKNAISSLSSPRQSSTPRKSGSGRRKGVRHSLPKYDVTAPVIMTLDSLGLARSSTCTALRQYIVEEAKTKKGWDIDGSLIKGMTAKGVPTQSNFSDCGLYLCAYMEKFILNPAGFVGKILQRQMDPNTDMPMMASEELRSRMRAMIKELHHEQGSNDTEFPIPEVGSILLGPQKVVSSEDNFHAPRTQLHDDSEDELQQDHNTIGIHSAVRSPVEVLAPPSAIGNSANRPREASPASDTATSMAEILAKIDNNSSSPSKSRPGTKETAITIDDDDEPHLTPSKSSSTTKTPISKNDFFDHPSELREIPRISACKPSSSTAGGTQKAREELSTASHHRSPAPRAQSHESTESFSTQFLKSGQSYNQLPEHQHSDERRMKKRTTTGKAQKSAVVMIPDSQESLLEEVVEEEEKNDEARVGGDGMDLENRRESGREAEAGQFEVYEDPDPTPDRGSDPDPDPDRAQEILQGV